MNAKANLFPEVIHGWLWWVVYETSRESGHTVKASYKAAQRAVVRLY